MEYHLCDDGRGEVYKGIIINKVESGLLELQLVWQLFKNYLEEKTESKIDDESFEDYKNRILYLEGVHSAIFNVKTFDRAHSSLNKYLNAVIFKYFSDWIEDVSMEIWEVCCPEDNVKDRRCILADEMLVIVLDFDVNSPQNHKDIIDSKNVFAFKSDEDRDYFIMVLGLKWYDYFYKHPYNKYFYLKIDEDGVKEFRKKEKALDVSYIRLTQIDIAIIEERYMNLK